MCGSGTPDSASRPRGTRRARRLREAGLDPAGAPGAPGGPGRRAALAAALASLGALGLAQAPWTAAQGAGSPLAHDGHAWRRLTEPEKLAWLGGFLVGAAVVQAGSLGLDPADATPEALQALRRQGRLGFAYAPTVYKARLEDFYVYQDRLAVPLYRALALIEAQLREGGAPRR